MESIIYRNPNKVVVIKGGKGLDSIYTWANNLMSNREQDHLQFLALEPEKIQQFVDENRDTLKGFEVDRAENINQKLSNYTASLNILKMASGIEQIRIDSNALDAHPTYLQFNNGIVNLLTGELIKPSPIYLFTKKSLVDLIPGSNCPLWVKSYSEIFPDVETQKYVQRIMGSVLGGEMPEFITFFIGSGQNGKSLCVDVIQFILGDFAAILPFSALLKKRTGSVSNDQHVLKGKRLGVASETATGAPLDEQFVKSTTATRTSTSRKLYGDFEIVTNISKIFVTANEMPLIKDRSRGLSRRLLLIYFKQSFAGKADVNLLDKLLENESSGILNWLIEGYQSFKAKPLSQTEEMEAILNHHMALSDPIDAFLSQMILLDPNASTKTSDLLKAYERWCQQHPGVNKLSNDMFYKELSARFPAHKGKRSESIYHGLKIVDESPSEGF